MGVPPPRKRGLSQNQVVFLENRVKNVEITGNYGEQIEKVKLRWGPPDSADGSGLATRYGLTKFHFFGLQRKNQKSCFCRKSSKNPKNPLTPISRYCRSSIATSEIKAAIPNLIASNQTVENPYRMRPYTRPTKPDLLQTAVKCNQTVATLRHIRTV